MSVSPAPETILLGVVPASQNRVSFAGGGELKGDPDDDTKEGTRSVSRPVAVCGSAAAAASYDRTVNEAVRDGVETDGEVDVKKTAEKALGLSRWTSARAAVKAQRGQNVPAKAQEFRQFASRFAVTPKGKKGGAAGRRTSHAMLELPEGGGDADLAIATAAETSLKGSAGLAALKEKMGSKRGGAAFFKNLAAKALKSAKIERVTSLNIGTEDHSLSGRMNRLIGRLAVGNKLKNVAEEKPAPLLSPASKPRAIWDLFIVVLVLYNTLVLPLQMASIMDSSGTGWLIFDTFLDLLFWIDMGLNFVTPYTAASNGEWVTSCRYTSINYLKSWFFIDLLSCLPIDSVMRITAAADESPGGDGDGDASALTGSLKVAKLAKLFKNIRLLRLARIAKMVARYSNALPNTGQIVRIFLAFLFFTHCCGCFFLFVSNTFSDDPTKSWTWGAGINPVLKPASQGRAYIIGSFNALLMLFGTQAMPEHTHQTDAELITVIVILLIGSVCHATLYGQMAHLMTQLNSSSTKKKSKLEEVKNHLHTLGIDRVVCDRVLQYYNFCWTVNQFGDREAFYRELSPPLHDEICLLVSGQMVQRVDMFQSMKDACLVEVVKSLRQHLFLAGDFIITEGTHGREMFFINLGQAEVVTKGDMDMVLAEFKNGDHFGEIALALPNCRRTATVVARTNCDLSALYLESFNILCKEFPELQQIVLKMAAKLKMEERSVQEAILAKLTGGNSAFGSGGGFLARIKAMKAKEDAEEAAGEIKKSMKLSRSSQSGRNLKLNPIEGKAGGAGDTSFGPGSPRSSSSVDQSQLAGEVADLRKEISVIKDMISKIGIPH